MNVHHLELFYYVAKYEGITAAVRRMPYGIQQPAVSGQILRLEEELGLKLFRRRPFALTRAGEELYDFLYPFFSQLPTLAERLRDEEVYHLRLGAAGTVLSRYLPSLFAQLRQKYPKLKLTLKEADTSTFEELLDNHEIDIAIAPQIDKRTRAFKVVSLIELPLLLLTPERTTREEVEALFQRGATPEASLISLPQNEPVAQIFQKELQRRQVRWTPTLEVQSLNMIHDYVAQDFGFGITVDIPQHDWSENIARWPLHDFAPLVISAIHQPRLSNLAQEFLDAVVSHAQLVATGKGQSAALATS